jgi:hypothetical protein
MKTLIAVISTATLLLPFAQSANAYSQDPRSCADRRTQFPSNPPCHHTGPDYQSAFFVNNMSKQSYQP